MFPKSLRAAVPWLGLLLAACDPGSTPAPAAVTSSRRAPLHSAEFAEARAALEAGHGDLALRLLERVPGFEAELLRARAELLGGDAVRALAAVERARVFDALHPEVAGTEAEILAALQRVQAAADVLTAGFQKNGPEPPLLRAQGVVELMNQGHAVQALEALERARAKDPELPFLKWPLAQAHLLVGREQLEKNPAEATIHAQAARRIVPELLDAIELEAEGCAGELRFREALQCYSELEARGRDFGETPAILQQRWATRCLLERDRAGALEHYLAARALGLSDEGLGFGVELLRAETEAAVERGIAAAEAEDWSGAEREFARALELTPGDLEAENHLAVARFRRADYRGAAAAWEHVLARAQARATELPDPVPLNLAKAWRLAGEAGKARAVLSQLLDREPEGPLSEPARELLVVLEAEAMAEHK
ncbi:MAG: hypothetical protein EXS08_08565 [Planctomycetes bacterium]|nr:hypothetical protein [Planctomycetota bacterium]